MSDLIDERKRLANELADLLCQAGFKARIWMGDYQGRVYLNDYGKDIKAYFQIDPELESYCNTRTTKVTDLATASEQLGLALKVYSNAQQSHKWIVNRCKQIKHAIMTRLVEVGFCTDVCENWQQVIL